MRTILVPVDFSTATDRILRATKTMATALEARVVLLNVAPREADVLGQQLTRKVITEPVPDDVKDRYENLMRCAQRLEDDGIDVEPLLVRGELVITVTREAERADAGLIIMGSHGRGALYRTFVGSVSEGVLRAGICPVLIIPTKSDSKE